MKSLSCSAFAAMGVLTVLLLSGCGGGSVNTHGKILRTDIKPVYKNGMLQAISFESQIKTPGGGQTYQIRYVVALIDRNGRPVMSADGRYQIPNGQVAAARAVIVPGIEHMETMHVSIPADQLELYDEHLPASADVCVYRDVDTLIARKSYPLPITSTNPAP